MSVLDRTEAGFESWRHYRITTDKYHTMIADGLIAEGAPFELLDGQIVRKVRSAVGEDPMTINPGHVYSVQMLAKLGAKVDSFGCHFRSQQPILIAPDHEPEPDGTIVRGNLANYVEQHPKPSDVLFVAEVSDASLNDDRTRKQRIYANAGIPIYAIINLIDGTVELYTEPLIGKGRYGQSTTLQAKDKLTFPTVKGKGVTVSVRSLLPRE